MELKEKQLFRSCTLDEDVQDLLLKFIKDNKVKQLENLLAEGKLDINYTYDHPYYKTALQIACFDFAKNTSDQCVQLLLNYGANASDIDPDTQKQAIHFAAEGGNTQILKIILQHLHENNIDLSDSSAIFTLVQYINDQDLDENDFIDTLHLLLETDIDINIPDIDSGWTVIYMAAKYNFKQIIETIINKKGSGINLDSYKDQQGKSARDIIMENKLYSKELPEYSDENSNITVHTLYKNLRDCNANEFITNYKNIHNNIYKTETSNLLYLAIDNDLEEAVEFLLTQDVNVNIYDEKYGCNPLQLACRRGYFKIVKILIQNSNSESLSKALIEMVKATHSNKDEINYNKCLNLLLNNKKLKINYQDDNKNTSLHYAARYKTTDVTLQILKKGASLACRDSYDKLPIADMTADTLKAHLDQCIFYTNPECSVSDKDACLTVNLTSLLPPRNNTIQETNDSTNCKLNMENQDDPLIVKMDELQAETEVLQYMCTSSELKPLLKHPVILTFLYLKWHRIRMFFYINLAIYTLFLLSLITYISFGYNQKSKTDFSFLTGLSYSVLIVTFVVLVFRELSQIVIFRFRYFLTFENWLEMILLTVTAVIIIEQSDEMTTRQFSAVAIVASAIEFLLLVGQFPSMSTNIMMLRTVSYTFFKLLLWYSILLFAFAYSFYTLFQENEPENVTNKTANDDDEEQDFFLDPGMSLLKTIIMLTGEFDAGSIKFNTYPFISHIIFVMFVFLITIVLFNLLNGLAVSDTQVIKNDAELYGQILRVEHVAHVERVLLTNRIVQWLPNVRRVCLFPMSTERTEILVYPNQNSKIILESNEENIQTQCCLSCSEIHLDRKIQRAIRALMQEIKYETNQKNKDADILCQISMLQKQIENLQTIINRN